MIEQELKVNEHGTSAEFTTRSRNFLTLARQITQVSTDYEILGPALQHLKSEHEWISAQSNYDGLEMEDSTAGIDNSGIKDIWDSYLSECQLLKVYAKLYETRTRIAINEVHSMAIINYS